MKLLDIITAPWAIEESKLLEIREIYLTHLRGEKIDIAAVEARVGKPLRNEQRRYEVRDGVAVVPLEGVLAKRANLFTQVSGGSSTQMIGQDIRAAASDGDVKAIVLSIDSPGGEVSGTEALAQEVRAAARRKPVVSVAEGAMASAAYWIGAAADEVYIADQVTRVGSIGVVATHIDTSRRDEAMGIKRTDVTAGRYKRVVNDGPLSEDGRATMQAQVDHIYSVFVDTVAEFRGVTSEKVIEHMADGRVFLGRQAIDVGLVDGISSLDKVIAQLAAGMVPSRRAAGVAA